MAHFYIHLKENTQTPNSNTPYLAINGSFGFFAVLVVDFWSICR